MPFLFASSKKLLLCIHKLQPIFMEVPIIYPRDHSWYETDVKQVGHLKTPRRQHLFVWACWQVSHTTFRLTNRNIACRYCWLSKQSTINNKSHNSKPPSANSFKWHLDPCVSVWTAPITMTVRDVTICNSRPNAPLKVWSCIVMEQTEAVEHGSPWIELLHVPGHVSQLVPLSISIIYRHSTWPGVTTLLPQQPAIWVNNVASVNGARSHLDTCNKLCGHSGLKIYFDI